MESCVWTLATLHKSQHRICKHLSDFNSSWDWQNTLYFWLARSTTNPSSTAHTHMGCMHKKNASRLNYVQISSGKFCLIRYHFWHRYSGDGSVSCRCVFMKQKAWCPSPKRRLLKIDTVRWKVYFVSIVYLQTFNLRRQHIQRSKNGKNSLVTFCLCLLKVLSKLTNSYNHLQVVSIFTWSHI